MAEFTNGELKLLFQRIDEKLDDIRDDINNQDKRYDKIEQEVDEIKTTITKIMAIGGTVWSAVTLVAGFVLQRIFS